MTIKEIMTRYSVWAAIVLGAVPVAYAQIPDDIKTAMDPTIVGLVYWGALVISVAMARAAPQS